MALICAAWANNLSEDFPARSEPAPMPNAKAELTLRRG